MEVEGRSTAPTVWLIVIWFAGALVVQMWQPLWWDEIFTMRFIEAGPLRALTDDYHSNNHRLFTLLAQGSVAALGSQEWILRLPSVLPSVASLILLARYLRREHSNMAVTVAIGILGFSPLLLHWLPQARGYGLTLLSSTLLIVTSSSLLEEPVGSQASRHAGLLGLFTAGFVGISTLPHFVVPFSITALGLSLAISRHLRGRVVLAAGAAVSVSSVVYLLGYSDRMSRWTSGTRGQQMEFLDAIRGPFRFLVVGEFAGQGVLEQLVGNRALSLVIGAAIAVLCMVAVFSAVMARHWRLLLTVAMPLFGTFSLFAVMGLTVTDRTLLFLLPNLAVLVAAGAHKIESLAAIRRHGPKLALTLGVTLSAILIATFFHASTMVGEWVRAPIEDFAEPVRLAGSLNASQVVTDSRYADGFRYYGGDSVVVMSSEEVDSLICDETVEGLAYLYQSIGRRSPLPLHCLRRARVSEQRVAQRTRGEMVVWFIGSPDKH